MRTAINERKSHVQQVRGRVPPPRAVGALLSLSFERIYFNKFGDHLCDSNFANAISFLLINSKFTTDPWPTFLRSLAVPWLAGCSSHLIIRYREKKRDLLTDIALHARFLMGTQVMGLKLVT